MNQQTEQGSKAYLISIVMVAVLGGLLFGYDTAVISGAEKGLQAFFMEAKDFLLYRRLARLYVGLCPHRLYHRLRPLRLSGYEPGP